MRARILAITLSLLALGAALSGCQIGGYFAQTAYRTGSHTVEAQYDGLESQRVAVLVAADRSISLQHPSLVPQIANAISLRIAGEVGAEAIVPPARVLQYQYDRPQWAAMPYAELAKQFDVNRLVIVDLYDFRLNEPGNAYTWEGVAAATVGVVEADGAFPDEFSFSRELAVTFPDAPGYGPNDFTANQIATVLTGRITDRVAWLFYEHTEKNVMEY